MLSNRCAQKPPVGLAQFDPKNPLGIPQPAGLWLLNENTGLTAFNLGYTGAQNNGALIGGPSWIAGPKLGPAISVASASSQYIDCGPIPALSGASQMTLFAKGNQQTSKAWTAGRCTTLATECEILQFTDGNTYFVTGTNNNFGHAASAVGENSLCMVVDGTQAANATRLAAYRNGVPLSLTFSGTIPSTISSSTDTFRIGRDQANSNYSDGRFDIVAVWPGVTLSAAQVAGLSAAPLSIFRPKRSVVWSFSGGGTSLIRARRTLSDRVGSRGVA